MNRIADLFSLVELDFSKSVVQGQRVFAVFFREEGGGRGVKKLSKDFSWRRVL